MQHEPYIRRTQGMQGTGTEPASAVRNQVQHQHRQQYHQGSVPAAMQRNLQLPEQTQLPEG